MGQYNQAVITTAGQGLLAGVIASGKALAFTNAKTSTHIYPSGLEALTDITDVMQTDAVSSATVMSNTQVKISTRFTNEGITAAYDINTIGIFAKAEGDTNDTLFAVITAVTPDAMPKYTTTNPVAYIYDITVGMSNADSITLNVSPTGTPSYGDLAAAQTAAENASAANLAPAYDSTATYSKDDFCVNGGKLYQCNADISTAEAFNPAHWNEVKVTEVMGGGGGVTPEIMAQIENAQWKTESSNELFSETVTTADDGHGIVSGNLAYTGDITSDTITVTFNGEEYVCNRIDGPAGSHIYGGWDVETNSPKFDEIPFAITTGTPFGNLIYTQTAGTYTITASVDTVTTTDTFKKVVNNIAGWKTTGEATLFDESVTTTAQGNLFGGSLAYSELITSDTLKVTFNGVEYTCPKISDGNNNLYGGIGKTGPDFTEFPFVIISKSGHNEVYTETAGTYTISAVGESTIYTDEFEKAVKSIAGAVEITGSDAPDMADIAIVTIPDDMSIEVKRCTISSSGNVFDTNNEVLYNDTYIFYKGDTKSYIDNEYAFVCGDLCLYYMDRSNAWAINRKARIEFSPSDDKTYIRNIATFSPIAKSQIKFYRTVLHIV